MGYWFIPSANLTVTELSYNLHFFDIYIYAYKNVRHYLPESQEWNWRYKPTELSRWRETRDPSRPLWPPAPLMEPSRQLWICPLIFHVFPMFDGFFHEFPCLSDFWWFLSQVSTEIFPGRVRTRFNGAPPRQVRLCRSGDLPSAAEVVELSAPKAAWATDGWWIPVDSGGFYWFDGKTNGKTKGYKIECNSGS
jgi:hypothetical protein